MLIFKWVQQVFVLYIFMDSGVDLSCIVKAVPTVSSDDRQDEQTHEVLQVSRELFFRGY